MSSLPVVVVFLLQDHVVALFVLCPWMIDCGPMPGCQCARVPVDCSVDCSCARVPVVPVDCPCARVPVIWLCLRVSPCARVPVCPGARVPVDCSCARVPVCPWIARVPVCLWIARVPMCPCALGPVGREQTLFLPELLNH